MESAQTLRTWCQTWESNYSHQHVRSLAFTHKKNSDKWMVAPDLAIVPASKDSELTLAPANRERDAYLGLQNGT